MRLALRLLGFVVGIVLGWQTGSLLALAGDPTQTRSLLFVIALSIGSIGYALGPHVNWAVVRNVRRAARTASVVDLVAVAVGLAFGGVVAALLALPLAALPDPLGALLPLVVAVVASSLVIVVALQRKRDLIVPWLPQPHAVPAPSASKEAPARVPPGPTAGPAPVLRDTSVVTDGRVANVSRPGFLDAPLVVPGSAPSGRVASRSTTPGYPRYARSTPSWSALHGSRAPASSLATRASAPSPT